MKPLLLLPLILLVASCTNSSSPKNYSFDISDKVNSFTLEKDDEAGEYLTSCTRDGSIAWDLIIEPEDFTGAVSFDAKISVDDDAVIEKKEYIWFDVINGKMKPAEFYHYSSLSDPAKYKAICSFEEANQYKVEIDRSSLIMTPGIHPDIPKDSSESASEEKQ